MRFCHEFWIGSYLSMADDSRLHIIILFHIQKFFKFIWRKGFLENISPLERFHIFILYEQIIFEHLQGRYFSLLWWLLLQIILWILLYISGSFESQFILFFIQAIFVSLGIVVLYLLKVFFFIYYWLELF